MSASKLLDLLRGRKTPFHLVEGSVSLLEPSLYPFEKDTVPTLFDIPGAEEPTLTGYASGYRSIVVPSGEGRWLKAKGVGIAVGSSKPVLVGGRIHTFYLSEATIGEGQLIWGLSMISEAENEVTRMLEARELGLPAVTPVGVCRFDDVAVLDCRNRAELMAILRTMPRERVRQVYEESGRPVKAASVFVSQPTDVRADEILYGFLHPLMCELVDPRDCGAFLRWMGSSCGLNLRMHHDAGLLHGTVRKEKEFMTNSHTANHLVDEGGTYTTDYHMAYRSEDRRLRRYEAFILASLMNPLPKARKAASEVFNQRRPLVLDLGGGVDAPFSHYFFESQGFRPEDQQERFTEDFLDGVASGYNKQSVQPLEGRLRREILLRAAACKRELFTSLGLPVYMQRGVREVTKRLAATRFDEDALKASRSRLEDELG